MDVRNDQLNAFIERGVRINAIVEVLESVKKNTKDDETRAIAAAVTALIGEIRTMVFFKS